MSTLRVLLQQELDFKIIFSGIEASDVWTIEDRIGQGRQLLDSQMMMMMMMREWFNVFYLTIG
jgi:hypothetical protein